MRKDCQLRLQGGEKEADEVEYSAYKSSKGQKQAKEKRAKFVSAVAIQQDIERLGI